MKFIYFDVGGVVIKDFSGTNKWIRLRRDMGIKPEQDIKFEEFFDKYEPEVCLGRDIETLVPLIKKQFNVKFSPNYSFLEDFVKRFEKNDSIWPVLESATKNYKIGLLTNMYPNMLDLIKKRNLMPDISWNVVIDSSTEKLRKPQKEIFELAQQRAGVSPSEILFVENGKKHVDAAKKYGWNTFLYDSSNPEKSSAELMKTVDYGK